MAAEPPAACCHDTADAVAAQRVLVSTQRRETDWQRLLTGA